MIMSRRLNQDLSNLNRDKYFQEIFNKTTQIGISYNWLKGKTYIKGRDS